MSYQVVTRRLHVIPDVRVGLLSSWSGVELSFGCLDKLPELLSLDLTPVFNYHFDRIAVPVGAEESIRAQMQAVVDNWLTSQLKTGALWYDRIRKQWRYLL